MKNSNGRLQRPHKLQALNFYLKQTERLLASDVFKKKKNKVWRKQKITFYVEWILLEKKK